MKCQNCGENEASIHYRQIVNGIKKEYHLCQACAEELGIGEMEVSLPIDFSSFFGEFLENHDNDMLQEYLPKQVHCDQCGMTMEEFVETGKFGCANCYEVFQSQINQLLKNIHGTNQHIGRKAISNKTKINPIKQEKTQNNSPKEETINKIETLKQELKQAIQVENYEEAAKLRDEIKKWEGENK